MRTNPECADVRVLVVEHDVGWRCQLERALGAHGYTILAAADGPQALHILEHLAAHEQPAAILLNLQLPIMSGQQFVYEYHRLPVPHAPIIALGPPLSMPVSARIAHQAADERNVAEAPVCAAPTTGAADPLGALLHNLVRHAVVSPTAPHTAYCRDL